MITDNAKLQRQEGIDAVIVDSVLRVRKELQGPEQAADANGVNGGAAVVSSTSIPVITETNDALHTLTLNGVAPETAEPTEI